MEDETYSDDTAFSLNEEGQSWFLKIVDLYNEGFETDEIANFMGLTELQVKILLILGYAESE